MWRQHVAGLFLSQQVASSGKVVGAVKKRWWRIWEWREQGAARASYDGAYAAARAFAALMARRFSWALYSLMFASIAKISASSLVGSAEGELVKPERRSARG